MRVGVSLRSAYPVADVRLGARWMIERARAARDAGLDSLFVGDHHAVPVPYYQNVPMLGRLLAEWGDKPAGALFLLPLWNPVLVAEQVGTLASLTSGRFVLQCAVGAGDEQFRAMGVPRRERAPRFEAALDVVRRLLRGEEVTTDGPYDTGQVRIAPVPPEPVEIWIGGAAAAAVERAARLGDGFVAGPEAVPSEAAELVHRYRKACAIEGREPTAIAIRRDVHVGADERDAERVAGPVLAAGYRGFHPDAPVCGTAEQVAESFRALAALGYTDVIVRHLADDQREVLASMERLAAVRESLREA